MKKISSYTNLKFTSTVHISQSTYLETMFHTSLQLQFTYTLKANNEYYFCRNVFENNGKRER